VQLFQTSERETWLGRSVERLTGERKVVRFHVAPSSVTVDCSSGSEFSGLVRDFKSVELVIALTDQYGLDLNTVLAIIYVESRYNASSVSEKGAQGLMQVMPYNFGRDADKTDPVHNIFAGVSFFDRFYNGTYRYRKEPDRTMMSVASYNCGRDLSAFSGYASARPTLPEETKRYVDLVMQAKRESVKVVRVRE
jgi:soluble lytic murein transglycosylase-like protein